MKYNVCLKVRSKCDRSGLPARKQFPLLPAQLPAAVFQLIAGGKTWLCSHSARNFGEDRVEVDLRAVIALHVCAEVPGQHGEFAVEGLNRPGKPADRLSVRVGDRARETVEKGGQI